MTDKSNVESRMVNLTDYEMIRKISRGEFGCVYLIKSKINQQILAAKVSRSYSENSIPSIIYELSILFQIQGPTIIPFYGFSLKDFEDRRNLTILMKYQENGSLARFIELERKSQSPLEYDNTAKQIILCGIAHGMMSLHSHDLIHYDLKSSNVLLDSNLFPCITDFGMSHTENTAQLSYFQGTPLYMSPEVINGDNETKKSDVYSFGLLMYEVLSGQPAYSQFLSSEDSSISILQAIVCGQRPEFNFPIKSGLKLLIEQCWDSDPEKRPTFKKIFEKLSLSIDDDRDRKLIQQQLMKLITGESLPEESKEEEDCFDYCLENVDVDRVLDYVEFITTSLSNAQQHHIDEEVSKRISEQKQQSQHEIEAIKQQAEEQIRSLQKDKECLKQKIIELSETKSTDNGSLPNQNQSSESSQTKDESINLSKTNFPDIFIDLNNYTLKNQIGQGSFGHVHIIEEKSTSKLYAIKTSHTCINLEINADVRSEMNKINREIQTLTTFRHAAILRFIGFSPVDFNNELCPSIITEYHEQGSLRNFIQNEHHILDDTQKLIILYGIASGMSFLHEHDYIHRDLKPENILLDLNSYPIIADFGLSKFINQNNDSTRSTNDIKGSPMYIAPEIFVNENREYTKESDVYAFSIIIYELITNSIPYEGLTSSQIQEKILTGNLLKFPRQYQKSPFRQLFMNCQQTDASCRPTFSEIVNQLNEPKFRDGIDEETFDKYIKSIEDYNEQFDPSNEKLKFSDFLKFQQRNQTSKIPFSSPRCWQMVYDAIGNGEKLYHIGRNIYDGKEGFSRDRECGNVFIQKSADLGYLKAILLYAEHMEKEQKYEESASYYLKAAELGHSYGEFKYGEILLEGRGIPQDKEKGLEYLSKSMKQGSAEAECLYQKYHNQ